MQWKIWFYDRQHFANIIRSCFEIITSTSGETFRRCFHFTFFFEKRFVCFHYDLFFSHPFKCVQKRSCSADRKSKQKIFSRWRTRSRSKKETLKPSSEKEKHFYDRFPRLSPTLKIQLFLQSIKSILAYYTFSREASRRIFYVQYRAGKIIFSWSFFL